MAQQWLHGGLPYIAVWDQHPPGMAALFAVAQAIIPDPVIGARLAASLAVALTAILIQRFGARHAGRPRAGMAAAVLYIVCTARWFGLAANTEVFNCVCVTAAAYLLYSAASHAAARRRGWGGTARAVAAALILGVGLQIKYVVIADASLLCLFYLALRRHYGDRWTNLASVALALMAAGLAPTLAAVAWFAAQGALAPFLAANISANVEYLSVTSTADFIAVSTASGLAPVAGAVLVAIIALARLPRRHLRWHSPAGWIAVWLLGAFVNACLPLKFYGHYWIDLYPPLCLAATLSLARLAWTRHPAVRTRILAAGLATAFATAVPYMLVASTRAIRASQADTPRAVARYLLEAGAQGNDTFVYDYQPVIYALVGLRPPTPYVLGSELSWFTYSSGVNGPVELERIMDGDSRFVVLNLRRPGEYHPPGGLDDIMASRLARYHLVRQMYDSEYGATVRIYERGAAVAQAAIPR